ncbi:type IV pilin protein [Microbulbifer variabilis]|uniref:type IV pilin protein n=1 Tax=Microbulbifer variabilis TaxID=266805 RepID=UPI00299D3120|nr:type IV pilin protein [Microbulbifer variabilis]
MSTIKIIKLNKSHGFTLIELMIVVAVIGIISAIAYPSYMESVRKSNRSEAKAILNDVAQRLQRCFTAYSSYDDYTNCSVAADLQNNKSIDSENNYYSITGVLSATTYTLTAAPVSGSIQGGDSACTGFTLTQAGVKTATGSNSSNCW